ncbi:recombining binding protein suppressor of hairless-like protein [Sagmatias obliquidens]|uniref:recombining binding protein suppressor of hairless-like protein n=1 Tax=Sagmatias obliquidens TaxID=3371155 RepID=UPI000F443F78|nr:recombining binding protein suppressor of hairless-like protein [Lagenorhynchus obliquidens]
MDPVGAVWSPGLAGCLLPADPSAHPGPLTHLSLPDSSEARPQSGADGRSLPDSWTRSSPEPAAVLREGVRQCLQQQCEQTVRILHAKVAQKSYGNEKRFFCPPPCVYLAGPGWRVKPVQGQAHQAGETGPIVCGYMGLDGASGSAAETQKLNFEEQPDSREFGCAKTLYISDADKRKHFRLVLRLVLRGGRELGTFHSRLIKVISKPSQKKQSLKNTDLCISSGSKVSLFNRLRSQTVSTRYLSVEDGDFVASARQWAAFTLHLADEHSSQGDFPPREGYVHYGSLVQLICTVTGITLPPMIIRKVAKQCALLDVDEPISQLHKCAFQFPGGPPGGGGTYLCLATEKVVQFQASPCPKEANKAVLNDSSCWTIIGTESVEFSFSTSLACTREPVTPVPLISTLEVNRALGDAGGRGYRLRWRVGVQVREGCGLSATASPTPPGLTLPQLSGGGDVATLELHGENLHAGLKVWFGEVEAETMYRSPRSLVCVVPDIAAFGSDWRWLRTPITVPVSLVRADGLFYPSAFSFTYTPEYSVRSGPPGASAPAADADALLESIHHEFTRTNFHLFIQT